MSGRHTTKHSRTNSISSTRHHHHFHRRTRSALPASGADEPLKSGSRGRGSGRARASFVAAAGRQEAEDKAAAPPPPPPPARPFWKQDSPPPALAAEISYNSDVPSACDVGAGGRGRRRFEGYFADAGAAATGAVAGEKKARAGGSNETSIQKEVKAVDDNDDARVGVLDSLDDQAADVVAGDSDDDDDDADADLMFEFDDL